MKQAISPMVSKNYSLRLFLLERGQNDMLLYQSCSPFSTIMKKNQIGIEKVEREENGKEEK